MAALTTSTPRPATPPRPTPRVALSTDAHEPARFARKEVLLQCSIRPTEPQPNALNAPKVKVLSVVGC